MSALTQISRCLPSLIEEISTRLVSNGLAETLADYIDTGLEVRIHIAHSLRGLEPNDAARLIAAIALSLMCEDNGISTAQQSAVAHLVAHRSRLVGRWGARRAG